MKKIIISIASLISAFTLSNCGDDPSQDKPKGAEKFLKSNRRDLDDLEQILFSLSSAMPQKKKLKNTASPSTLF